jgi:type II secretory pathway component PulF
MPNYSYQAINETGTTISGTIEADSLDLAEMTLAGRGLIPSKVKEQKTGLEASGFARLRYLLEGVKTTDLILFTKQFRSMLRVGVPIIRLFQVLEAQTENRTLKVCIASMAQDIKQGMTLTNAMERHPRIFSSLYCSMIRAGEVSGTVPDVLERLIYILEHEAKIKSDIKSALQYPILVVVFLFVAFIVLLTFVIPKFVVIFARANLTLPLPTRIAVLMYQILSNYWYLILMVAIGVFLAGRNYFRTENGKFVRDSFFLRLPLFGPLFIKASMSRFASIFAILQASGVPVMTAMGILSGTIGNAAISRQFDNVQERLKEGHGISAPLRSAKFFTPMTVDMVAIGEESGNIDEMLREVSSHYDDEVAYAVKNLAGAIGPVLIVGLAAVVGFFALAIFLPMWNLTQAVQK